MRKHAFFTGLLWLFVLFVQAQRPEYKTNDTLLIDEIKISAFQPVNDKTMLMFYKTSHFSSIDDITARLSNVSLIKRGAYAMEPLINGMGGGRINVTIDGMHMFGACTDKMDPVTSYIEPVNLASIQILPGSEGSKMGNTVGGSINLVTEKPRPGEGELYGAEAGVAWSEISNGLDGNVSFYLNQKKWGLLFSTSSRNHQNYRDGNGDVVAFSQFSKKNIHASFAYMIKDNHILTADVLYDDARNVGYPALPMDVSRATGQIYSLDYKTWNSGIWDDLHVKVYGNNIYHQMDDSQRDSVFVLENYSSDTVVMRMDMPGWSSTFGAYADATFRLSEKDYLSVKLDNYLNFARAEMTMYMRNYSSPGEPPMYVETWPDMQRFVTGIYAGYSHAFNANLNLSADVKLDYSSTEITSDFGRRQFSVFGYQINEPDARLTKGGSLSLQYSPDKLWIFNAGVGYSERIPDISELYGFYLYNAYDGYDYVGNPDLRNESALNAFFKFSFTSRRVKLKGETNLHYINDYILGLNRSDIPELNLYAKGTRIYSNYGNALISGSSLYAHWQPSRQMRVISTVRYTYGKFSSGSYLPLIEPLKNFTVLTYHSRNIQVQLENEYSAPQNNINVDYGETRSPAYDLVHFRIMYNADWEYNSIEIGAGIHNLMNKTYKSHLDWGNIYRPGRSFFVSLKLSI